MTRRQPFLNRNELNMADIAGTLMICIGLAGFYMFLGSQLVTLKVIGVLCSLLAAALFFAKK